MNADLAIAKMNFDEALLLSGQRIAMPVVQGVEFSLLIPFFFVLVYVVAGLFDWLDELLDKIL